MLITFNYEVYLALKTYLIKKVHEYFKNKMIIVDIGDVESKKSRLEDNLILLQKL